MKHKKCLHQVFVLLMFLQFLTACSSSAPAPPTTVPSPDISLPPTSTPIPIPSTSTPIPIPPTPTPTFTHTPLPPKAPWAGSTENMVLIQASCFLMGWEPIPGLGWPGGDLADDESPIHEVCLDAFYIDVYEVTNGQFKEFVDLTGYVTTAETQGGSWVVDPNLDEVWGYGYVYQAGAYWAAPQGPGSSIEDKMDHPVVHVSWQDAQAYADWAGKRLPTEAEWEKASRGTLEKMIFPWGVPYAQYGQKADYGLFMNYHGDIREDIVWSGDMLDGFAFTTSPVGSFPANGYGLFDMAGNVFEYVKDWYDRNYYAVSPVDNPTGPDTGSDKIKRGGSWSWCECYARPASRDPVPLTYSDDNTGFRLALDSD